MRTQAPTEMSGRFFVYFCSIVDLCLIVYHSVEHPLILHNEMLIMGLPDVFINLGVGHMNEKKIYLMYPQEKGTIAPEIYGHFTEHIGGVFYDGLWVGRDSSIPNVNGFRKEIIEKLRNINAPVIRWPGGCFAEIYDWRDGIGEQRPVRPNWWKNDDGKLESNAVGTHEFMDLCEAVGAKAYFAANLTSSTPLSVRNWMDYCLSPRGSTTLAIEREKNGHPDPFNIPYWGVGNENWGGGGHMLPDFYAHECRRYTEIMRNTAPHVDFIMCGTDGSKYNWAHGVLPIVGRYYNDKRPIKGYSMHFYCAYGSDPFPCGEEGWEKIMNSAVKMENMIKRNWNIICGYGMDDHLKLVVDEWGVWHAEGSGPSKGANLYEQAGTVMDAMVAAVTLNIFNNHCDKISMANIAQLVNNIHSLFLASGEQCITTPTYHIFDMYKEHQGATAIETTITNNADIASSLSVSASVKDGKTLLTIANLSVKEDARITLESVGMPLVKKATGILLHSDDVHAHNTFENPDAVVPEHFTVDLTDAVTVPKAGVLALRF